MDDKCHAALQHERLEWLRGDLQILVQTSGLQRIPYKEMCRCTPAAPSTRHRPHKVQVFTPLDLPQLQTVRDASPNPKPQL